MGHCRKAVAFSFGFHMEVSENTDFFFLFLVHTDDIKNDLYNQ